MWCCYLLFPPYEKHNSGLCFLKHLQKHRNLQLELSYTANFLSMMFKMTEHHYKPNPVLERALDVLFILHADHELNQIFFDDLALRKPDHFLEAAGATAAEFAGYGFNKSHSAAYGVLAYWTGYQKVEATVQEQSGTC